MRRCTHVDACLQTMHVQVNESCLEVQQTYYCLLPHAILSAAVIGMSVRASLPLARRLPQQESLYAGGNRAVLEKQRC